VRQRQPSVNGDWLSQWKMAIFNPLYRIDTPEPITKKIVTGDCVGDYYTAVRTKFGAHQSMGASGRMGMKYN